VDRRQLRQIANCDPGARPLPGPGLFRYIRPCRPTNLCKKRLEAHCAAPGTTPGNCIFWHAEARPAVAEASAGQVILHVRRSLGVGGSRREETPGRQDAKNCTTERLRARRKIACCACHFLLSDLRASVVDCQNPWRSWRLGGSNASLRAFASPRGKLLIQCRGHMRLPYRARHAACVRALHLCAGLLI
jgi:hypothetical protein